MLSICLLVGIWTIVKARTQVKSWKSNGTIVTLSQNGTLVVRADMDIVEIKSDDTYYSTRGNMEDYCIGICPPSYSVPPWFYDTSSITGLVIEEGVISIGKFAFYGCSGLTSTSIVIPNSVKHIGGESFLNSNLTSVIIGNGVRTIGRRAFEDNSLISVVISGSVRAIGNCAFCGNNLPSVVIPNNVAYIGDMAFSDVDSIIAVPDNPNYCSVDGVLFNKDKTTLIQYPRNRKDTAYTVPKSVTYVGNYAFTARDNLMSVTIPNSVELIGIGAFFRSDKLTSVTIGDSVTAIEYGVFSGCSSLISVTILNPIPPFIAGVEEFVKENWLEDAALYIPALSMNAYKRAPGWNRFKKILPVKN
jgi:hypothetical protein